MSATTDVYSYDIADGLIRFLIRFLSNRSGSRMEGGGTSVAVVGATGAVGVEMIKLLEASAMPIRSLRLLASANSAGKHMSFRGNDIEVEELTEESFAGVQIVLFSAGAEQSAHYAPIAVKAGALVVDNSSHFRMHPNVPLVVPSINGAAIREAKIGIVANPNCTTAVVLMALFPLHEEFRVKRVFASSYQAVSGSGQKAIEELRNQVSDESLSPVVYEHRIAFNVIAQIGEIEDSGYTKEEEKLMYEGRKILSCSEFRASVTCVRVPVYRAHSIAVSAEFEKPINLEKAKELLQSAAGLDFFDSELPQPLERAGKHNVCVGRVRRDCALDNGLAFFVVGDQLLRGAALNAVEIAEMMYEMKML